MDIPPFLYWFENLQIVSPEIRERFGRFEAFTPGRIWFRNSAERGALCVRKLQPGPKRKLLGQITDDDLRRYCWDTLYSGKKQDWLRGRVCLGVSRQIKPDHLLDMDKPQLRALPVKLGDGNYWDVPVVALNSPRCELPYQEKFLDGEFQQVAREEFRPLAERAMEMHGQLMQAWSNGQPSIDFEDAYLREFMIDVLQLRYNITLYEASALGLFAPEVYWPFIRAAVDWDSLEQLRDALQEGDDSVSVNPSEAAQDGSNTNSGEPDYSTLTNQQLPMAG